MRISPGDVLVAFTDGISEAMNLEDEEWGEDRLLDSVRGCHAKTAQELLESVFAAATQFACTPRAQHWSTAYDAPVSF